ncbi:MAG: DUF7714 family protein [Acidimicrobiales bacterium]
MTNVVPSAYRGVAVADVDVPIEAAALVACFVGRECYRHTRFIVVRNGSAAALLRVEAADRGPLFSPIIAVEVMAGSDETVVVQRPEIDTAVPSQLALAADGAPADARAIVVFGRYGHVSFLLDPEPVRIQVRDVVPPRPAKLLDQARRVLEVAEDLPPTVLVPDLLDLGEVVPADGDVLLPCRGSGIELAGRRQWFLDEHPAKRDWTLVGCARSHEIHRWFYDDEPGSSVDLCPSRRVRPAGDDPEPTMVLTKCCLQETEVRYGDGIAIVPWGATLDQVREALGVLIREAEPAWAPV